MRKSLLAITFAIALLPSAGQAQIRAGIQIDLPVVLPPLVVISPGVQVVQDYDREVFFTDGYYWVREDGGWYRSRNHRTGWAMVPVRTVPPGLVRLPPGHYKRWKPAKVERGYVERAPYRAERRDDDDRYERRHEDRDDHGHHDNGRGHGHGKEKHGRD